MIPREQAWSILTEFTKSDSLRKHARAVEASMRAYAVKYGEDPDAWGAAGILHDFDYEVHPRAPHHPVKGAEILLARDVPQRIVYAVLAHADYSGMPRLSLLAAVACVLATAAAVLSFVQGSWIGVVWVMIVGLSSNMSWYYLRRERAERRSVTE